MTSTGDVYWISYDPDDTGPNYGATWSKLALTIDPTPSDFTGDNSTRSSSSARTSAGASTSSGPSSTMPSGSLARAHPNTLPIALMTFGLALCGLWSFS